MFVLVKPFKGSRLFVIKVLCMVRLGPSFKCYTSRKNLNKDKHYNQGILTEGKADYNRLPNISSLIFIKRLKKFYKCKVVVLNRLVQGGQFY